MTEVSVLADCTLRMMACESRGCPCLHADVHDLLPTTAVLTASGALLIDDKTFDKGDSIVVHDRTGGDMYGIVSSINTLQMNLQIHGKSGLHKVSFGPASVHSFSSTVSPLIPPVGLIDLTRAMALFPPDFQCDHRSRSHRCAAVRRVLSCATPPRKRTGPKKRRRRAARTMKKRPRRPKARSSRALAVQGTVLCSRSPPFAHPRLRSVDNLVHLRP